MLPLEVGGNTWRQHLHARPYFCVERWPCILAPFLQHMLNLIHVQGLKAVTAFLAHADSKRSALVHLPVNPEILHRAASFCMGLAASKANASCIVVEDSSLTLYQTQSFLGKACLQERREREHLWNASSNHLQHAVVLVSSLHIIPDKQRRHQQLALFVTAGGPQDLIEGLISQVCAKHQIHVLP